MEFTTLFLRFYNYLEYSLIMILKNNKLIFQRMLINVLYLYVWVKLYVLKLISESYLRVQYIIYSFKLTFKDIKQNSTIEYIKLE